VKNKKVNSIIGGVGGGLGSVLSLYILILSHQTSNLGYLVLFPILFVILLFGILLIADKYVKVTLEE
jgi:hypothetical protein